MDRPHFGHRVITSEKCGTFKMYPACIRPIDLMGDTLQIWSANWGRLQFGYISNVSSLFRPGQIGVPWEGTFKMYPAYTHWAHWSHLLSVLPMYPVCAWWVFGSLSPVCHDFHRFSMLNLGSSTRLYGMRPTATLCTMAPIEGSQSIVTWSYVTHQ